MINNELYWWLQSTFPALIAPVSSTTRSLTTVFGMGTGVTFLCIEITNKKRYHNGSDYKKKEVHCKIKSNNILKRQISPFDRLVYLCSTHFCDLHMIPINLVVSQRSYSVLLQKGNLILEQASHLYAFSGYLFQAWLHSCADGSTTVSLEACPLRSSRTRSSILQITYGHSR